MVPGSPPKNSQTEPNMAILALSWPILGATCCHRGLSCIHLRPIFAKNLHQIAPETSRNAPRRLKTTQRRSPKGSKTAPVDPLQRPQNSKRGSFPLTSYELSSSPCTSISPKCSQHIPKTSQIQPQRSPSWRYHGPSWIKHASNLAPTSSFLWQSSHQSEKTFLSDHAQDFKKRPKIFQDLSTPSCFRINHKIKTTQLVSLCVY